MNLPVTLADVAYAERLLAADEIATAEPVLERMVEQIEDYAATELVTTDDTQYFSFEAPWERIAYHRVENDPRTLVNVDVPLDRVYADLGYALIRQERMDEAARALAQAVRWNPMRCAYRLDLAELKRAAGDTQEWLALSHSVMERASEARELARAYVNFGQWFLETDKPEPAVGCLRVAQSLSAGDARVQALADRVGREVPDADAYADEVVVARLAEEGLPAGANAEVCVCLLMCASDALDSGDTHEAARLTVRARNLIGEDACKALIQLIRESDAELAAEKRAASDGAAGEQPATGEKDALKIDDPRTVAEAAADAAGSAPSGQGEAEAHGA